MSVEKRTDRKGRVAYLVRWRDSAGAQRAKTVRREKDAILLDSDMKRRKAMGELIEHERGAVLLEDFWPVYWERYAKVHLASRTLDNYAVLYRVHIAPAFGRTELRKISREMVDELTAAMTKRLAPASIRRVLAVLQGVLQRAVDWKYIGANPAMRIKKPPLIQREGIALTDEQVNAICAELDTRSQTIARALAYTGLRPGELRALRWADFSRELIRVDWAISKDVREPTKTRKRRSVNLREEARRPLMEHYLACGKPAPASLVFPSPRGGVWTDQGWKMWQRQVFLPAAARAGLKGVIPYDLRHTFASKLIHEGRDPIEVSRQLGHSPTMTLETYAHEFKQQREGGRAEAFDADVVFGHHA